MKETEHLPKPIEDSKGQSQMESPTPENSLYSTKDVKTATGITSSDMVRRYVRRLIIKNPNMGSKYLIVNWGNGPKILLTEEAYKNVVDGIISLRGVPIEQPTNFPDGRPIPRIKSNIRRRLLTSLLQARDEERFFHMQESWSITLIMCP